MGGSNICTTALLGSQEVSSYTETTASTVRPEGTHNLSKKRNIKI